MNSHTFFHTQIQCNLSFHLKWEVKKFYIHLLLIRYCLKFKIQKMRNKINMILILRLNLKMIYIQIHLLFQICFLSLNGTKSSLKQLLMLLGIQMTEEEHGPSIRMNILHSLTQLHYLHRGAKNFYKMLLDDSE